MLTSIYEQRLYVAGLFGCTSVVIISEMGVWFSHHYEAPSFLGDDAQFKNQVLDTIKDGDPDDPTTMPGSFSLAGGDGILNVRISRARFISSDLYQRIVICSGIDLNRKMSCNRTITQMERLISRSPTA